MIGPGVGESRSGRISCSFYLYFGTLGYFTFGITNLSLQCGSVLSQWNCKFKIAWNCFPIIFLRLPSPKKVGCITMHMELAQERFIGYFCSLDHSSARNKFGLNTGFTRFVRFYFTCTSCFDQRF